MQNYQQAYLTQTTLPEENRLRAYVNKLQKKIDYAKWKQNLVLCFNYLPLSNVIENIQKQYDNYKRRMEAEQSRLRAIVDNEEFMLIYNNLKQFREKLLNTAKQSQLKIQKQKELLHKLKIQCKQRRQQLKTIMKTKKYSYIIQVQQHEQYSQRNTKLLTRSKSTATNINQLTGRSSKNVVGEIYTERSNRNIKQIYQDCIGSLIINNKYTNYQKLLNDKSNIDHQKIKKIILLGKNKSRVNQQQKIIEKKHRISWEVFRKMKFDWLIKIIGMKDSNFQCLRNLI